MRKKYNWLFIIQDQNAEYKFRKYKKDHPKVKSENRLARSFVKANRLPLFSWYEKGCERSCSDIAKVSWIES